MSDQNNPSRQHKYIGPIAIAAKRSFEAGMEIEHRLRLAAESGDPLTAGEMVDARAELAKAISKLQEGLAVIDQLQ